MTTGCWWAVLAMVAAGMSTATVGLAAEGAPQGFTCVFKQGGSHAYDKGTFKADNAEARIQFEVSAVDVEAQSAKLHTGKSVVPLKVVQAISALHFLEVAVEGYLNITTIYARDAGTGTHPAVHSRHFGVLGQPLVSQYRGFCHPKS